MSTVFLSTSCIDSSDVLDSIRALSEATRHIELSGGSKHQPDNLASVKAAKQELGIDFLLHSYFPPPKTDFVLNFADSSSETRDFIGASMRYVAELAVPYFSVHAGYKQSFAMENEILVKGSGRFSLEDIARNIVWFRERFPDTPLAVENLYPNNKNPDSCYATSVAEIEQILAFDDGLLLLLDLGHLKISANLLGFDFCAAVDHLFSKYARRIVELHLSENESIYDDHDVLTEQSDQYRLLKKHKETISRNSTNLTIEARGKDFAVLQKSHDLVKSLFGSHL